MSEEELEMAATEEVMKRAAPAWLEGLMAETFFGGCGVHQNRRKNEKNIFCLYCCQSFCPHCLPSHHPTHPLLQVRRYVYQDVIRLGDLEKLIDCSYIQPYTINSAKVIFLNQRAQSRSCKGSSGNTCFTCDRILQDPFNFCSLSCKVEHMVYHGEDLSSILHRFDHESHHHGLSISQFEGLRVDADDGQITPNSILEDPLDHECGGGGAGNSSQNLEECSSRSKGAFNLTPGIMLSFGSRRKRAPHRSPLS